MRIAFSNDSRIWGGAEIMTEVLARGFQARGHEVVVLCRPGSAFVHRLEGAVPTEPALLGGFDMNPRAVWRCLGALRRHRPDLVLTMTQKDPRITGPAARLLNIPVVVCHAMDVPLRNRLHHRFFFGTIATHFIANSQATRRTLLGSADWLRPEDVSVIYNGIDVARFADAPAADLGLPDGAIAIGFVARFEARKGIRELVEAWPRVAAAVPRAHLVLVGSGGDLEASMRERLPPSDRVHWLGFRRDLPEVMHALDVLVLPSYYEGFGLVLAEAMAAGKPVVATRASNFPELVKNGVQGLLVELGSVEALASALIELASDPAARRRMGRAGAERVRREFSLERMFDEYERVLPRLAAGRGGRR